MLFDVLAVAAGFVAVILLLSLAVTSIVEIAQNVVQLRRRVLFRGLMDLLDTAIERAGASSATSPDVRASAKEHRSLMPRLSVDRKEMPALTRLLVRGAGGPLIERVDELFPLMERRTSEIFKKWVLVLSITAAVAVAFVMQVDSLELVRRLTSDAAYRDAAVKLAESLVDSKSEWMIEARDPSLAAEEALAEVASRHPDLRETIEQASGEGSDRALILKELDLVLAEEAPQRREEIMEEFEAALDQRLLARIGAATGQLRTAGAWLAGFDLRPWQHGWGFYADVRRILGTAITAALLTLGAPFWFDVLSKVVGLLRSWKPTGQ